jgi:hypothetical protein
MSNPKSIPSYDQRITSLRCRMTLAICICILFFACGIAADAQNRNAAEIRGTVHDASGGAVQDVSVTAINNETGQMVQGKTNASGIYDFPYVPSGTYTVTFVKDGYGQVTRTNLLLTVAVVTVDADLRVGNTTAQVQVDASTAALLQSESPEINLTLSPDLLMELPNVGGNWQTMTELLPGVAPSAEATSHAAGQATGYWVSINGSQTGQSGYLLDGGVATNLRTINPGILVPPLDAIAEVNTSTALFGAESGNGTAIMNVITKGGTNQFHGAIWERVQNTAFEAKTFQASGPITPYHWNQYGFAVGGPVLRNRLFFFGSFQRNPTVGGASAFYTEPEDAVRGIGTPNGDAVFDPNVYGIIYDPATQQIVNGIKTRQPFPNNTIPVARISPIAANVMQYYPRANMPFSNGVNYSFPAISQSLTTLYTYRMDYDVSQTNRLLGSIIHAADDVNDAYPANPSGFLNLHEGLADIASQLTDVWSISPSLVNEARISGFHFNEPLSSPATNVMSKLGLQNAAEDVFPYINISGGPRSPSTLNNALFATYRDVMYEAGDSVTWSLGKHSLKFGGEWNRATDDFAWDSINSGNFNFTGVATINPNLNTTTGVANAVGGSGLADFLLGDVASWTNTIPIVTRLTVWNLQAYAQDSYKIQPNLTATLGLRFLHQAGMSELHGRYSNFEPNLINPATGTPGAVAFGSTTLGHTMEKGQNFFQPRLGVAWSFRPSWVLRGGFGLYNIQWSANNYSANLGIGYSAFGQAIAPTNSYEPAFNWQSGIPSMTYPTAANLTPSSLNGSSVNYQPYNSPIVYLAEYQVGLQHLIGGYMFDVAYVGTKGSNLAFWSSYTQIPLSQLGSSTHPFSQYSNVTYLLNNGTSNYNSLQIQSKKQFKNGFIYQATYTYAKSLDTGTGTGGVDAGSIDTYQNSYDPMANYGPTQGSLRHTFNGSAVYELPFGRNKPFLNSGILMDALFGGWQVSTAFQFHTGTPFTVVVGGADDSGRYSGGSWFPNQVGSGKLSNPKQHAWFNTADFQVPAPDTLGNERRNGVYGPGFSQIDLSAAKSFRLPKLGEGTFFEFKADAFNALNHPNLAIPNNTIYSTPALNEAAGSGSIAGAIGDMRKLQLAGHIRF